MAAGTITLRTLTQSGATTKGSALTHEELDSNFLFLQSGSGAISRTAQAKMREIVSVDDFSTAAQFNTAYDALGTAGRYAFAGQLYATGNIGVGTRSPQDGLHLKAAVKGVMFEHTGLGANQKVWQIMPGASTGFFEINTLNDDYTNVQTLFHVKRDGTFGAATYSATGRILFVGDSSGNFNYASELHWDNAASPKMLTLTGTLRHSGVRLESGYSQTNVQTAHYFYNNTTEKWRMVHRGDSSDILQFIANAGTVVALQINQAGGVTFPTGDQQVAIEGSAPVLELNETDGGTNTKKYWFQATGDALLIRMIADDEGSGNTAVTFARTGTTPGTVTFGNGIATSAPSGGTSGVWKLGVASVTSPTSPNRTIELDVGGTIYYLHAKTTNN